MRVLLISHTCQSATEGQPKAFQLAQIPGVELTVLSPDRWRHYGKWRQPEIPRDAPFRYIGGKVQWPWLGPAQNYAHWYPGLGRILRTFRPDIIDLWEEPWGLVSAHACWLRDRLLPTAKIVSETEQNILKTLPPPFEHFRSYTLRHADFAVGRNSEAIEVLRAKGYKGQAEVVPNAVDAELFRPLDKAACRAEYQFEGFVVGYAGRLVEEKGLAEILHTLVHCAPEVNAVFVGQGTYREELERLAGELGLNTSTSTRVRFLGRLETPRLPRFMNALDAFILPSRTTASWKEQFGRVIIEANACEVPVIGSSSGAIPEVIEEGGLVFPEGDARALADSIEHLRQNPDAARAMGQAGRRQAEAKYTWQRVAQRMHGIYTRLLEPQNA